MKLLNYFDIKYLTMNNDIVIDFNKNLYNHPFNKNKSILDIDLDIKDFTFNNIFNDLVISSSNNEKLATFTSLRTKMVLNPSKPYINTRDISGFEWFKQDLKNHIRNEPVAIIKKKSIAMVPLSITIRKNTDNIFRRLIGKLNQDLYAKNIRLLGIQEPMFEDETIYAILSNTGSVTRYIKDLDYILDLYIEK